MNVMKIVMWAVVATASFLVGALTAEGQESSHERVTINWSDPARAGLIEASLVNGTIRVRGYEGREVIVESKGDGQPRQRRTPPPDGLRPLIAAPGLSIEEQNNVLRIGSSMLAGNSELAIQAPAKTSLKLRTINGGEILVEGIEGELDVSNVNGAVTLRGVSGSVVAHALNGKLTVAVDRADPGKPMSFSSLNGVIDVTLPASIKANFRVESENGEVFTNFDIDAVRTGAGAARSTDQRAEGGKFRYRSDRTVVGTVNGGGPEFRFKNFNGSIYIRKGE